MPSHLSCILREYVNTTPQFLPSRSSLGPATIPPNTLCTLCLFKLLPPLSIPHTFSSTSGLTSPTTPHDPSALSYPLETLLHHANTARQHGIARRVMPFFATLSNLEVIQAGSARCLVYIRALCVQLTDISKNSVCCRLRGCAA